MRGVMNIVVRCAAVLLLAIGTAHVQKPDFSGLWVLNSADSKLQNPERPVTSTFVIIHRGENWHVERTHFPQNQAPDTETMEYVINNRPVSKANDDGGTTITRMYWQESALILDQQMTNSSNEHATNRVAYTLSADGKKLTALEMETYPDAKFRNSWVFDRLVLPAMRTRWPGTGLSADQVQSLKKAIHHNESDCDPTKKDFNIDYAMVDFGKLGPGVMVRSGEPCDCGATGNCAIWVYQKHGASFHELPFRNDNVPYGSTFTIAASDSGAIFLVVRSHLSAELSHVSLYEFVNGLFNHVGNVCIGLAETTERPSPQFDLSKSNVTSCSVR